MIMSLLSVCFTFTFGQTITDTITLKKAGGEYQFYQGEQCLSMKQLVSAMKPNEQAYKQIKSAQASYTIAMVFSYVGGFLIGWPIGTAIGGGDPNWAMAGIGAGCIAVAIPLSHRVNIKTKQAVDTYNGGLQTSSFWDKSELNLSMTANGIGLSFRF